MLKFIKNINSDIKFLILLVILISISIWLYMPKDIYYKYSGLKYQIGNLGYGEPVSIEIDGKYSLNLLSKVDEFNGKIAIGDKVLDYTNPTLRFDNDKMAGLGQNGRESYGVIYISNAFGKITIEIFIPTEGGGGSFSSRNGWLISAPCNDRKEAVEMSNKLIPKRDRGGMTIE